MSHSHAGALDGVHAQNPPRTTVSSAFKLQKHRPVWRSIAHWAWVVLIDLDFIVFIAALLLTGLANGQQARTPPTYIRPFFIADVSTWHPWTEPDTVPIWTLFVFGYFVLATIVGISEYIFARRIRNVSQKRSLLTALRFALGLWTSTMLATMLVENGKNFVGRLRPSFAERCLGRGAVPPTQASDLLRVITEDSECIAGGAWEGRRSFPSGHASLSVGMGVYFQMWTMRVAARGACHGGLKALSIYVLGIIIFAWGLWVAASRVVDNAHHVSDVAVGAAIGGWLAAVHFQMVANETDRLEMQERDLQASGIDDHHHHHHHHHAG